MKEMRFMADGASSPIRDLVGRSLAEYGDWSVSSMRACGFGEYENAVAEFRALAPLQDKAQVVMDQAVVKVGLQRLVIAADVIAAGNTHPLSDPLSVTQLEYNKTNKVGAAQRTMNPSSRNESKMPITLPNRLPIYLTTDGFEIDIRTLRMSQRVGTPLDTTLAQWCTRSVNEAIEDALINGATTIDGQTLTDSGYTAPGLLNEPNVNSGNITAAAWYNTTPNGNTVLSEVLSMIKVLQGDKKFGPYRLYVPTEIGVALDADFNATNNAQGLTIKQRLLQIEGLDAIKTADLLPRGNLASPSIGGKVALVQMTEDVVDMVVGQYPTIIPWTSLDGFTINNLVMAIMVPRVRSDYDGNSGIYIGTSA